MTPTPPQFTWKDEVPCEHDFTLHWGLYRLATTPCLVCARCGKVELIGEEKGNEQLMTRVMP